MALSVTQSGPNKRHTGAADTSDWYSPADQPTGPRRRWRHIGHEKQSTRTLRVDRRAIRFRGLNSPQCGWGGIRTPGTLRYSGFQDRRNRPLCHPSKACFYWVYSFPSSPNCKPHSFFVRLSVSNGLWRVVQPPNSPSASQPITEMKYDR